MPLARDEAGDHIGPVIHILVEQLRILAIHYPDQVQLEWQQHGPAFANATTPRSDDSTSGSTEAGPKSGGQRSTLYHAPFHTGPRPTVGAGHTNEYSPVRSPANTTTTTPQVTRSSSQPRSVTISALHTDEDTRSNSRVTERTSGTTITRDGIQPSYDLPQPCNATYAARQHTAKILQMGTCVLGRRLRSQCLQGEDFEDYIEESDPEG